jgi:ABC-type antimicrobial peptide transport system permease subunit
VNLLGTAGGLYVNRGPPSGSSDTLSRFEGAEPSSTDRYGRPACGTSHTSDGEVCRNLGIRAALGARPSDVRRDILGEGGLLVAVGLGVGAMATLFSRPWLDANLFPSAISEPAAVGVATAGVILAATVSTIVPAVCASRIDPIRAMRERS